MKKSGCRCDKDGMNNGKCAEETGWGRKIPSIVWDGVLVQEQGNGWNRFLGLYVLGLSAGVLFFCLPSALLSTENGIPLHGVVVAMGNGGFPWLCSFCFWAVESFWVIKYPTLVLFSPYHVWLHIAAFFRDSVLFWSVPFLLFDRAP